ncbi:MAG: RnfABCDGE type electron transport complex subunit D [Neomegalonema sp.]|nr:RnfABCDGE type electron transport complex subunit D [Neomegalonema sp.]
MTDAAYDSPAPSVEKTRTRRPAGAPAPLLAPLRDPRYGQIAAQALLISFGVLALGFNLSPLAALAAAAGALVAEYLGRWAQGRAFDPLSPLITAGSLTLLFRAEPLWLFALAGLLAVGSKFLIRMGGRHIFNPAALSLFILPLTFGGAWLSPGQWGALGLAAIAIAGVGSVVAGRAARLDTTLAFLAAWAALSFGRALYFGDPMSIPIHQLQSGAILVFAFFMISDPATTPPTRAGRILHAVAVAGLGFWLQTSWITNIGPVWALIFAAPLVGVLRIVAQPRPKET